MGQQARRKARQKLAEVREVRVHTPEGYGEPTKSPWEYANTPYTLYFADGKKAVKHLRGAPHVLATELDIDGTPFKHKPQAHRSRQWRRLFGKNGMHGLAVGLTFKEWAELGFPKVPLRSEFEGTVKPRVLRSLFLGAHKVDDQVTAYARKD